MNDTQQKQLGSTLWAIADQLRGAMNADDFRDYMLSFLFLRYLSDNCEDAVKRELGSDYRQSENEIAENVDRIGPYLEELKQIVLDYGNSLPPQKLGLNEGETDRETIRKARAGFVDEYNKMLSSRHVIPLAVWYIRNLDQVETLEKQMRRKIHFVIKPAYLWSNIYELARTQNNDLLKTLQRGFKYIENESFESRFRGLFSEVNTEKKMIKSIPAVCPWPRL